VASWVYLQDRIQNTEYRQSTAEADALHPFKVTRAAKLVWYHPVKMVVYHPPLPPAFTYTNSLEHLQLFLLLKRLL